VLIQAQALRTILNGGLLKLVELPIMMLLIVVVSLFWFVSIRTVPAGIILLVLIAGFFGAALLVQVNGSIFPLAAIVSSLTISIAGRQGVETYLRLSERRRLKLAFSGYVSPAIMREIVAGALTPSTKGVRVEVCVLFADIRDYTSISEHMTPEDVISFLNRYYEGVVKAIHAEGGSVTTFMGDGVMAVFGAPNSLRNPCLAALNASQAMLKAVVQLNVSPEASGSPPLKIGIGLHVGMAVMGHVGASDRHDYSAIGDVTNTASRIEGLTKAAGFSIVCSRAVFEAVGCPADFKPLGEKAVKGRSAIEVFGVNAS
jgi:adenylate cyclase